MKLSSTGTTNTSLLKAGAAKVDITPMQPKGFVNDPLFVKALVLEYGTVKTVLIAIDAIALDEIGSIGNDYLCKIRNEMGKEFNIPSSDILISATHVHTGEWKVCSDIEEKTIQALKEAFKSMVPVKIGVGSGYEDRVMENRRLRLKNGKEWTIRHANPLPPDDEVAGIGPVDPEIGILRLDKKTGDTLAVVYNFACHPYQGVPNKTTTADFPGFASKVIEDNLSEGTIAFYLQGCAADISTILYKDVNNPRDAEILGNMLGISTLRALRKIKSSDDTELKVISEIIKLPRRKDFAERIDALQTEQAKLLQSLQGTSLNFKTFIPLFIKYSISSEYPSYYSHRYLREKMIGRNDLESLDIENRRNMDKYLKNIYAMEKLARIQENMSILKERQAENEAAGEQTIDVEIQIIRMGSFILVTFPGEVSVQIGLNIKRKSPHNFTFITGYTNGYIHYAPTARQLKGEAYEDTNCLLAPEWEKIFEKKVLKMLNNL